MPPTEMTGDDDRVRLQVARVSVPRVVRLWSIVRYHHWSQIVMRVIALLKRQWRRSQGWLFGYCTRRSSDETATARRCADPNSIASTLRTFSWPARSARPAVRPASQPRFSDLLELKLESRRARGSARVAAEVWAGRFGFLNQPLLLGHPPDWRLTQHPETPRLWRFHLHDHNFLLDLAAEAVEHPDYLDRVRDLMHGWIEQNPCRCPAALDDAWHPACISRRLPVWLLLCSAYSESFASDAILASIVEQTRFLTGNLEWDLRGNHLLENLKAMAMAGAFFEGRLAERWLNGSARLLPRQLDQQILPHGEHFERSPMYHCLMLELVLDVRDATRSACPELAEYCARTAGAMAGFLQAVLHPDGQIPLLGDSSLVEATAPADLLKRAVHWQPRSLAQPPSRRDGTTWPRLSETRVCDGYWTFRDGDDFVLLDAGPVGPDHLPAHAHSDLLTWEASLGGKRFVVDSGVFHYQDDAMRQYCRATEAHNVLQIDHRPLCDTWSSFRMGYRGWPSEPKTGETAGFSWIHVHHNACRRSGVPRVIRFMACGPEGPWICVDFANGQAVHRLTQWLHLHPDAVIEDQRSDCVHVAWLDRSVEVRPLARGELTVLTGWYCPSFGVRQSNLVLRWTAECRLPMACGWSIGWQPQRGSAVLVADGEKTVVEWRSPAGCAKLHEFTSSFNH